MPYGAPGFYRVSSRDDTVPVLNDNIAVKQDKRPLFCQFHVDVSLQEHHVPQVVHTHALLLYNMMNFANTGCAN